MTYGPFIGGITIGLILAAIWAYLRYSDVNPRTDREDEESEDGGRIKGPITLEHYHWGLLLSGLLLAMENANLGMIQGIFISLFAVETLQKYPFGFKKKHFPESSLLAVLIVILIFLALL